MDTVPHRFTPPASPRVLPCPEGPRRSLFQSLAVLGLAPPDAVRAAEAQGVDPETLAWVVTRFAPYLHLQDIPEVWKTVATREAVALALASLERPGRVLPFLLKPGRLASLAAATRDPVLREDLLASGRVPGHPPQGSGTQR